MSTVKFPRKPIMYVFIMIFLSVCMQTAKASTQEEDQTVEEFVERAKSDIDALRAKAEGTTFWKEKAEFYKEMIDKANEYHMEGMDKFPGSDKLPQLGKNSYGETEALEKYGKNILADKDWKISQEKDPGKRYELLKERLETTGKIHDMWQSGAYDERVAPTIGANGLGESALLRDQGKSILEEMDARISQEKDLGKRSELLKERLETTMEIQNKWQSGAYDERVAPKIGNGLGESTLLRDQGESITKDLEKAIENENNPTRKEELQKELRDFKDWEAKQWENPFYDERYRSKGEKIDKLVKQYREKKLELNRFREEREKCENDDCLKKVQEKIKRAIAEIAKILNKKSRIEKEEQERMQEQNKVISPKGGKEEVKQSGGIIGAMRQVQKKVQESTNSTEEDGKEPGGEEDKDTGKGNDRDKMNEINELDKQIRKKDDEFRKIRKDLNGLKRERGACAGDANCIDKIDNKIEEKMAEAGRLTEERRNLTDKRRKKAEEVESEGGEVPDEPNRINTPGIDKFLNQGGEIPDETTTDTQD